MNTHVNWTHEETRALISVWSEKKIQFGLGESVRNERVYGEVSNRLAAMGMSRSAKQCRDKIKKLKLEYRRIRKQGEETGDFTNYFRWYDALDSILGENRLKREDAEQTATIIQKIRISDVETDSTLTTETPGRYSNAAMTCNETPSPTNSQQDSGFYSIQANVLDGPSASASVMSTAMKTSLRDSRWCSWSKREVQALLTLWANPAVQEELLLNVRNNQVYTRLSAALESLGFSKTPQKCREKIKKLKQDYKRLKTSEGIGKQRTRTVWFSIMDDVLGSKAGASRFLDTTEGLLLRQTHPPMDVNNTDDTTWLPDEVQVLLTLWAQPNIQKQLLNTANNAQVFTYLSSELALVGFNKTPHQCSVKVNQLKEEYRQIKDTESDGDNKGNWFVILDGVLGPGRGASEEDSSAVLKQTTSSQQEKVSTQAVWTSDEVKVLLTRWAGESIQEQLRSDPTTERVFAQLSSDLATQGFDKTTSQCRSKIGLLKEKYRRVKEHKDSKTQKGGWFSVMDKVLGRGMSEDETKQAEVRHSDTFQQTSHGEISDTERQVLDHSLSVSSLCLLVPSLRLMCAFAWQVIQCCNVMHYGKVEELVRVVAELAPELLTPREKAQILLRLRARTVLELCRKDSTANPLRIQPHLTVIKNLTTGCMCDQEEREELENSKSNFVEVIQRLLEDTEERRIFFKEVFPVYYGHQYEAILQTLVWKFISRLDNLLPVPDIKQTAEWLSSVPSVMEECGRLVLDSDQLKALLNFHQQQSGVTTTSYFQNQNLFLPRLCLPPKPNKKLPTEQQEFSAGGEDGRPFYCSEDEEAGERNQTYFPPTLEGHDKEDEGTEMKDEQMEDLTRDFFNHSTLKLQTCSLCSYSHGKVSGLLQHIREVHLNQEPSSLQSKEADTDQSKPEAGSSEIKCRGNTCEFCGKVFKFVSTLQSHMKTHTLPFCCDKCDKKYASMASLYVHQRNHTGETPYLCSHCGRGFKTSHSLSSHISIHTGERRYKCHICGKTSIQHLTRHMRMHRGEKNFLCTECGKAFLSSGELRLHTRYHTGERPYKCKYCEKRFVAKCFLTVHMRSHTGECPYKCTMCPKAFHTLRAQKKHMKIHSDSKSFQCLKCGKIFRQKDTYKMHLQTHEKE
ncbi:uncharacterized protein LOC121505760 [Cheilinus undulatus]|uniref:uncharacterized protein LOC121505760 n=1 Tax=Cheilinus undulatus TaxID=241271 RepID=UPI001BD22BBA|nr:uncharacterized protein LOC121505760 [Cheilinus undulatus]